MDHAQKIERMFAELPRRGIGAWTFAPPVYRALWKLGVEAPPPLFATSLQLFALAGVGFGVLWALGFGVLLWGLLPLPYWLLATSTSSVLGGVLFGGAVARTYRRMATSHRLPSWSEYGLA